MLDDDVESLPGDVILSEGACILSECLVWFLPHLLKLVVLKTLK